MHEQSNTIQLPDGRWINVYGRGLPQAGQQLPHSGQYGALQQALIAAQDRSRIGHDFGKVMPPAQKPSLADLLQYILGK